MLETTVAQLGLFSLAATSFVGGLLGLGLILAVLREMRLTRLEAALSVRRAAAATESRRAVTPQFASSIATQVMAVVVVQPPAAETPPPTKTKPSDEIVIQITSEDDTEAVQPVTIDRDETAQEAVPQINRQPAIHR